MAQAVRHFMSDSLIRMSCDGSTPPTIQININRTDEFVKSLKKALPESQELAQTLGTFFNRIVVQGTDEFTQQSFFKSEGYVERWSKENWKTWVQNRTALGQVESIYADYIKEPFEVETRLDKSLLTEAAQEATTLSKNSSITPFWPELIKSTKGTFSVASATINCLKDEFHRIFTFIVSNKKEQQVNIAVAFDSTKAMEPYFSNVKDSLILAMELSVNQCKLQRREIGFIVTQFGTEGDTGGLMVVKEQKGDEQPPLTVSQIINSIAINPDAKKSVSMCLWLKELQKTEQSRSSESPQIIHAILAISSRPSLSYGATLEKATELTDLSKKNEIPIYMVLPV